MRYFDGSEWWYQQTEVAAQLDLSVGTIAKWRGATSPDGEPLVRTKLVNGRVHVRLEDVFYVQDHREELMSAGVWLTSEAYRDHRREYLAALQGASLAFATRQGEEYTVAELREFADACGGEHTVFDEAVEHGRSFYGGKYARKRVAS